MGSNTSIAPLASLAALARSLLVCCFSCGAVFSEVSAKLFKIFEKSTSKLPKSSSKPSQILQKTPSKPSKNDPRTPPNPSQNAPKSRSGGGLGGSWGDGASSALFSLFLEASWGVLGASWWRLGRSWGRLGRVLGHLGSVPGEIPRKTSIFHRFLLPTSTSET